jgi:hypothetical protein
VPPILLGAGSLQFNDLTERQLFEQSLRFSACGCFEGRRQDPDQTKHPPVVQGQRLSVRDSDDLTGEDRIEAR